MNATDKRVRIGGACGFWGDSAMATPQLLQVPGLQYLVYDYLAETTMAILAKARAKDPALGYATDFVQAVMTPHLKAIHERGIKVIANAGGVTVSYFEWVQDFSSFFWSEDEINARLVRIMREAFAAIWQVADEHRVSLRTATFIVACTRILQARELRGLYP